MLQPSDAHVQDLGPCLVDSPLTPLLDYRQYSVNYVEESDRILINNTLSWAGQQNVAVDQLPGLEPAGPRRKIYFEPSQMRAAVVTCGGLCPGLNNVIRSLVNEFTRLYKIERVYGIQNGYEGFRPDCGRKILELTPESVADIHEHGGTMLGSSRGQQDPGMIVDCLERLGVNALMTVGGDGTLRGALSIADEIERRGLKISVIGIPKTIDNDIEFTDQSFGFQTAISEATHAIRAAQTEAHAAPHGIGMVKLMGRHSGFIACYASLAVNDANFVLIPEVPFSLEGERGLFSLLKHRLDHKDEAVIVVAEGAGQHLMQSSGQVPGQISGQISGQTDASGNARLGDVGVWLKQKIENHFAAANQPLNLKYIDPSYAIRSVPANAYDSVFCTRLAHNAVHAAMSGRTRMVVSRWQTKWVNVPIDLAIRQRNCVDPNGDLWMTVLESTGQPPRMQ